MQRLVTLQQRYRPPSDSLSISCFPCKRKRLTRLHFRPLVSSLLTGRKIATSTIVATATSVSRNDHSRR